MSSKENRFALTLFFLLNLVCTNLFAHAPRENYVWINVELDHVSGRFELNVKDIKSKLNIDVDNNYENRLEGISNTSSEIQQYLKKNFYLQDTLGEIEYEFTNIGISKEASDFAQYYFKSNRLPELNNIQIENTIFLTPELARSDRLHRSLIVLEYNKAAGKEFVLDTPFLVFGPSKSTATLDTVSPENILHWRDFLKQGILHIWFGFDHVLFVLVLLLTTVLVVEKSAWKPIENFGSAFLNTIKIITIFTIAHSITLSLATFGFLGLNSVFIETVIAASIIAVAINNLYPVYNAHAWILVFGFGLFHGMGFASVMADLQFRIVNLGYILLMFNIGVEIGQFAIVALIFPILFFLRKERYYRPGVVVPVSLLSIAMASYWALDRTGLLTNVF